MLCNFCLFFKLRSWCFNRPVATSAHGLLGLSPSLQLRFISKNASLLALYICAVTHGPTSRNCWLGLFSLGLFTVHIFSWHAGPFAFKLQVTWSKAISFVVGVLSTSFARVLLGLIHQTPSCPIQLS